ncbi:MAG: hypothetical protein ACHQRM_06070 [Bacteroidia bacterium]
MSKRESVVQLDFIRRLKDLIPSSHNLADEMADLLNISSDSAYRRIRGETALSIDEVSLLCRKFNVSFDTFRSDISGSVTFSYRPLNNSERAFDAHFGSILTDLKRIQQFTRKEIIYAAEDIPPFHYYQFPELTAFKIFYWTKSVLNVPSFEGKKFHPGMIDQRLIKQAREVFDAYITIPSTEVWTEETISGMLKQVEFYWDSGLFQDASTAITIIDQLTKMFLYLQRQAEHSTKYIPAEGKENAEFADNFRLYNSEVMIGNNCILVVGDNHRSSYLSYHTFNSMTTTNTDYCEETDQWLKNLVRKSVLMSGVAEKQRYQFFKQALEAVEKLRAKIV